MHFVCDKCNAKYSIPDEKIAGKILKLRCKRCSNTIVVKDPKAVASMRQRSEAQPAAPASADKGKALLQNAFKRSLSEPAPQDSDILHEPTAASNSDKTQVARIDIPDTAPPEEDWYLADRRGQFGPMDLKELIARIKRGEPQDDAVVWREGFDDWMAIHLVPELKPYRRHAPPPRRPALPEVSPAAALEGPPVFAPGASQTGMVSPMGTGQFRIDRSGQLQLTYGAVQPAMASPSASIPVTEAGFGVAPPSASKNRLAYVAIGIGGTLILAVAVYFAYSIGKTKGTSDAAPKPSMTAVAKADTMGAPVMKEVPITMTTPMTTSPSETVYTLNSPGDTKAPASTKDTPSSNMGQRPSRTHGGNNDVMIPDMLPMVELPMNIGISRSTAALKAVIDSKNYNVRRCYSITVRKGQSALVGTTVTASLRISASGKTSSVSFTGALPPMMKSCLQRFFMGLSFPQGQRTDRIRYQMHFTPT